MRTVANVVQQIERLLDLLPEPLVLRALAGPDGADSSSPRPRPTR